MHRVKKLPLVWRVQIRSFKLGKRNINLLPECVKENKGIKGKLKKKILDFKFPLPIEFLKWVVVDFARGEEKRLFGTYLFMGEFGSGKTQSMIRHIEEQKLKYKDVHVWANFHVKGQDGFILSVEDIINTNFPPNTIIAIDELQNLFNCRSYSDKENKQALLSFIPMLTQNRKLGVQFLWSAQNYEDIDAMLRRLTNTVVRCNSFAGRLFINTYYKRTEFDKQNIERRRKLFTKMFVASDKMRELYNTHEIVDVIRKEVSLQLVKENKKSKRRGA